jgi:hypothetical protein
MWMERLSLFFPSLRNLRVEGDSPRILVEIHAPFLEQPRFLYVQTALPALERLEPRWPDIPQLVITQRNKYPESFNSLVFVSRI